MAELTDKQQALLEELLKDFKGDARDIFGEGGLAQDDRQARSRGGIGGGDDASSRLPSA